MASLVSIASILGGIAAFVGIPFAGYTLYQQLKAADRENSIRSADLIKEYTDSLYSDSIHSVLQSIVYDNSWNPAAAWKKGNLVDRSEDRSISHFLDLLNSVCYAIKCDLLSISELGSTVLGYAVARAWENAGIRTYIDWVDEVAKTGRGPLGVQEPAFLYFRTYGSDVFTQVYPEAEFSLDSMRATRQEIKSAHKGTAGSGL